MESDKTRERIGITEAEKERLHRQLAASNIEIKEIEVEGKDGKPISITLLPHGTFLQERRRLAREREKAQLTLERERRKMRAKRQREAKRRVKAQARGH